MELINLGHQHRMRTGMRTLFSEIFYENTSNNNNFFHGDDDLNKNKVSYVTKNDFKKRVSTRFAN